MVRALVHPVARKPTVIFLKPIKLCCSSAVRREAIFEVGIGALSVVTLIADKNIEMKFAGMKLGLARLVRQRYASDRTSCKSRYWHWSK